MSDWEDFCESMNIDPSDPEQFDRLLDKWSKEELMAENRGNIGYKALLRAACNPECSKCGGTGYIGRFKWVAEGRCFSCLPDWYWEQVLSQVA